MQFQVLLNENERVAQLLHLFWCAARLFQVLLNQNQRVAQLPAGLFCCADRLFQVLLNLRISLEAQLQNNCF